jgi:hypothetical protein
VIINLVNESEKKHMRPDMVLMKEGRMVMLRRGDMIVMDNEMTMADGTKVMTDGTVILTDGTTLTLVEGEGMLLENPVTADRA